MAGYHPKIFGFHEPLFVTVVVFAVGAGVARGAAGGGVL